MGATILARGAGRYPLACSGCLTFGGYIGSARPPS
jgi:hypothetical protein